MYIESYFGVAYAALIVIFVFCGLLRCCDLWKPLGKSADELYPARRIVACVYFSVLLLLPCALHPQSPDARLLARCFWVLFIPAATSLSYKRFFYGDSRYKRLRIALVGGIPLAAALALSCIALVGGNKLSPYRGAVVHATGTLGALLTAYEIHVMLWLWHIRSGSDAAARAADKLFPRKFASWMLLMSSAVLAFTWVEFLFGSTSTNTAFAGTIAFVGIVLIFIILHPQRVEKNEGKVFVQPETVKTVVAMEAEGDACCTGWYETEDTPEEDQQESNQPKGVKKCTLSDAQLDTIEQQIRQLVEGRKLYLNSNLKQEALEKELKVNHYYLSEVFARRFGSLNRYLNNLRIEHAQLYVAEHPDAKQSEVAHHSGFGSVNSYYRARKTCEADFLT